MKRRLFLIAGILLFQCIYLSCGNYSSHAGFGSWEIMNDETRSPDIARSLPGWRGVHIPSTFNLPGRGERSLHYAWLRGRIYIEGDPARFAGLTTGRIFHSDETYINGTLVGTQGFHELGIMSQPRCYPLPRGLLRQGENDIYIRLGVIGGEHGGMTGAVELRERNDFSIHLLLTNFLFIHFPLEMLAAAFMLLLILIIFFLWNRNVYHHLANAVAIILYIILLIAILFPFRVENYSLVKACLLGLVPMFSIVLVMVIQALYHISIPSVNRILVPLNLAVIMLIGIIVLGVKNIDAGSLMAGFLAVSAIFTCTFLSIRLILRFNAVNPDRFRMIFLFFITILGNCVALFELVAVYLAASLSFLFLIYTAPLFIMIFAVYYARDEMKKNMALELSYNTLRTQKPRVNEESKEKIERVLTFIRENYTSDLSREGLASAVSLNPNYMSTLFRQYTGEKINDYINRMRIEEAQRKLNDKHTTVVEIAFSVGFESLSTFNRVFKNITGKTPTEYRESL